MARDLVLGTAGHIDHGKTALVRALTGVDTDRLPAEKERGITIEPGFAALDLGDFRLALVDVPGHERFIRNMLAGATGLDLAMLVVAVDDSVMPQTREHLEILRLLGLRGGLIVLTKCDLVEPSWLDLVEDDVRALVQGTFLEGAAVVRTSAASGLGIDALKQALLEVCEQARPAIDSGVFRMAVDRSFSVAGHGTVVTGTVSSGRVAVGDEVEWQPLGRRLRVRGLQRHERAAESVGRGARAAVNLAGVHHTEIGRGHELATPGALAAGRVLTVELARSAAAPRAFRQRGRYKLHLGTAETTVVVAFLEAESADPAAPRLAQLLLAQPAAAYHGQPFVLREESPPATLGGGRILAVGSRRCRRRDLLTLERLSALRSRDPLERLAALLSLSGLTPLDDAMLATQAGLAVGAIQSAIQVLEAQGAIVPLAAGSRRTARVSAALVRELEDRARRAILRLHAVQPRLSSVARAAVAAALPDVPPEITSTIIDRLRDQGIVVADARSAALATHQPVLTQAERVLMRDILAKIEGGGLSPPEVSELAAQAGALGASVPDLLALLREEGCIAEINPQLYLSTQAEAEVRGRVVERLKDGGALTMSELRDLLGTTRKYAVPLGEYLDRQRITRREGDARKLGPAASA